MNLWIVIGIFVVVTIFHIVNPSDMVVLRVEDNVLIMEGTNDVSYQVPIESIQSLEYVENPSYPENLQNPQKVVSGKFANEQWGEHHLCVFSEVPACVVAYAETGIYVFNCESEGTTKEFYNAMLKII